MPDLRELQHLFPNADSSTEALQVCVCVCVCVCLRVLHVLSADEMSWRLSMVPMHWVFEYPHSRLYTYLSLSLPSGIVHVFVCICG